MSTSKAHSKAHSKAALSWSTKQKPPQQKGLPFTTVEIVEDEAGQTRREEREYRCSEAGTSSKPWRNKLIWGDNKLIMSSLGTRERQEKIRLIYMDPPFFTGSKFSARSRIGRHRRPTTLPTVTRTAYRDTWHNGMDSYLQFMYERLCLARDLLTDDGSLYLHCDWHAGHYLKVMLDEIFGYRNFINEIVWFYPDTPGRTKRYFNSKHDIIFWYGKGSDFVFNADSVREEILPESKQRYKSPRILGGRSYVGGKSAAIGKVPEDVWRLPSVKGTTAEKTGYETQKPERLLKRIILASSEPGDLVADFFCGSGTTAAVAEKLGRRWITSDLSRSAIQTTRKRVLNISRSRSLTDPKRKKLYARDTLPFEVLVHGGSEEAIWQNAREYRTFILGLYRAQPAVETGHFHGKRDGRAVVVAEPGEPVSAETVQRTLSTLESGAYTGVDIIGHRWTGDDSAESPPEEKPFTILIKGSGRKSIRQPCTHPEPAFRFIQAPSVNDIRFSLAGTGITLDEFLQNPAVLNLKDTTLFTRRPGFDVDVSLEGRRVILGITGFTPNLDGPSARWSASSTMADLESPVDDPLTLIDYWAVDWDYCGDVFKNQWRTFRLPKATTLEKNAIHRYTRPGAYRIMVQAVDVLGRTANRIVPVTID